MHRQNGERLRLSDLKLALQYRTGQQLIARDFYERCLPVSRSFSRGVGFFATTCFLAAPEAFSGFFENGGVQKVVCCPILTPRDVELLRKVFLDRKSALAGCKESEISFSQGRLDKTVSWLVASGRLELRIAVVRNSRRNIYHEKIGIFEDSAENRVAFTGSANETLSGLQKNFEVVDIFRSWEASEQKRVRRKVSDFDALWDGECAEIEVMTFPQASVRGLIRVFKEEDDDPDEVSAGSPQTTSILPGSHFRGLEETLFIPGDLKLFPHQQRAVREWFAANGRGIFEMATGSGKTIAALATAAALHATRGGPLFVLIVCPYLHLVAQWAEVAKRFGLDPLPCAVSRTKWKEELSLMLYNLSVGSRPLGSAVVTNATFISESFQQLLRSITFPALIIADEVHNLGASNTKTFLPENFQFRLGLSATPERWFDPEGTEAIYDYFGHALVHYTIDDALRDKVLCEYIYHPVVVDLTELEMSDYYELTTRIARETAGADDLDRGERSDILDALLIKRARLIATAENKLPRLKDLLSGRRTSTHNLVYCGDGTVEHGPDFSIIKQMDLVTRVLGHDLNMRVARYIAETPLLRREKLHRDFADGHIQCLIAIRCLDEGVDIPETRRAFILASSTNPRQFIQRRGRVLRRAPGKDHAEIFDFIVKPPPDIADPGYFNTNRQLLKRELVRVAAFAQSARNGPEALSQLLPIRKEFNLLDVF